MYEFTHESIESQVIGYGHACLEHGRPGAIAGTTGEIFPSASECSYYTVYREETAGVHSEEKLKTTNEEKSNYPHNFSF